MKLEYSTVAQCRAEDVWAVFTDSTRWSEWSPLLSGMQWTSGEPWQPGSQAVVEIPQPSFKLKSTIKGSTPPSRMIWTGGAMGVSFECVFDFTPAAEGSTRMNAAIDLSGPAVFFINDDMKKKGLATFASWFESLKAQAEKIAAPR
ncbi:MAG TPA: SRPBCC family protein [Terriglobales bacterium]|nr:SRPBCC family protein [Terriglobales bacterium]